MENSPKKRIAARHFRTPRPLFIGMLWNTVCFVALLFVVFSLVLFALTKFGVLGGIDPNLCGRIFLISLPVFALLTVIRHLYLQKVTCPLCHGTLLHAKGCRKHRDAHRIPLLGYRLTTVLDIITRGWFTCMYCGTPFRLKR